MSNWTHSMCANCWNESNPDRPARGADEGEAELCCFCLKITRSGIYVRRDPQQTACRGKHGESK